jgi:DNA polymerase III epsilon subunit family exonuclease
MGPFIFLDIETTGKDPNKDHIIEVACIRWENGKITGRFESLVNPKTPIPYEITLLTGISDKNVADAPIFPDIKQKLIDFTGDNPIVGHNIAFDTSFLRSHHLEIKNAEIDTIALARILLQKESSYALEVLMKKYKLPLRGSHRAMADIETTVSFFEFLLGIINELPKETIKTMREILNKSDWSGKEIFTDQIKIKRKHNEKMAEISPVKEAAILNTWGESVTESFLSGNKILLESSCEIPFEKLKKCVVAYFGNRKRDKLKRQAEAVNLTVCSLKEPGFYFSPKKLAQKLLSPHFANEEIPLLLKLVLWNTCTATGERDELSFDRDEYPIFELFADTEGKDEYWEKALKSAAKSDVVLLHQYALARGLADNLSDKKDRSLIVVEAVTLEDSFTNAYRKRYTAASLRPIFGEKSTMLFGLLGIFFEHFSKEDNFGYEGNVILNDMFRGSVEWRRVIDALQNLPDNPKKQELNEGFSAQENHVTWINSFADEIILNSAPVTIGNLFQKCISGFNKILLQSPALSGDGSFSLVRELFELGSDWLPVKENKNQFSGLDVKVADDFPEPFSPGYFKKCLHLFTKIIEEKGGRVLFLMSSKKTVEAFYQAMLKTVTDLGVKLLAVGASGGLGKSIALFNEKPDGSVLLTTNQVLQYLSEIEENVDVIVFQKIPFDHPGDPLIKARSAQFEDGFKEYSLPRAVSRFREVLSELNEDGEKTGKPKICHILDSRMMKRDYGKLFL